MKRHIIAIFTLMMTLLALPAMAQDSDTLAVRTHRWFSLHDIKIEGRVGFNIGGTAPLGMPATIRHLDKFSLTPNISFGVSATKQFNPKWGLKVGINFENKGMKTDARVKNYSMEIVRGGQTLGGWFTGNVVTSVTQWMFTLPIQATMMARKVRLRGGLYASYLTYRDFSGWAYDGYLRVDGPTGEKGSLGHNEGERGEYDFSSSMRRWQWGATVGMDWYVYRRFGIFAELNWGFNGVHKSDFHTIEQTLKPIYGTLGFTYLIN